MRERLIPLGWSEEFERHFDALGEQDEQPARVVSVQKTSFRVFTETGVMPAVPSGLLLHDDLPRSEYPAIGDWVTVRTVDQDDKAVVTNVLPRRTRFSRALNAGNPRRPEAVTEQVIATNIDYVFIVTALDEDFSVPRIERYVAAVTSSGAAPVVVLNKADLHADATALRDEVTAALPGVPVHAISVLNDEGLDELLAYFTTGTTIALIGSSGVGKSTLTNRLLGSDVAATGAVREGDSKGRHTTTSRELYVLPTGGVLIDNPGLREIAVWAEQVEDAYEDIQELALHCRFRGCTHHTEPGCAVQAALADGRLDRQRFENYQRLAAEAEQVVKRTEGRGRDGRRDNPSGATKPKGKRRK